VTAPNARPPAELWFTQHWGVVEPDGAGNYRTVELGSYVDALPADAVRLAPQPAGRFTYADPRADRDHMTEYRQFWQDLVETDGVLDLDKVALELSDYSFVMDQVAVVYCEITDSRMSKPNYFARDVIAEADARIEEIVEQALIDDREANSAAALGGPPPITDVQRAAERAIHEVLINHAGTDAQGMADHIADALAAWGLLADDATPTPTEETDR
jgi:hypothetical protein